MPNLKTSMTLGAKLNINPEVTAKARFGQVKVKDKFHLPRLQRYVTTSMIVPLNDAFYFSLNYNGTKGNTLQVLHNLIMYGKLNHENF